MPRLSDGRGWVEVAGLIEGAIRIVCQPFDDFTSGPAEGSRYTIASAEASAAANLWLVRVGDQIGLAYIDEAAGPMPSATGDRVTDALLAAVRSPDSYTVLS